MAVLRKYMNESDEEWERHKCNVDLFLKSGFGLISPV